MKIETLVSTMNNNLTMLNKMNIHNNCIVINQCDRDKQIDQDNNITWLDSSEIGLSKSRNQAIKLASAEIAVIADDDLVYLDDYEEIIYKSFKDNPNMDILVFKVEGINKKFKEYNNYEKRIGYIQSMKVSSVQIAFRTKKVKDKIFFNELFGAGSKYSMGEENIFLFDSLRSGLKIKFIPIKIADLYIGDSTWFNGFNEKYLIDRGASFYAMSAFFSYFLILQFAIRKHKLFKNNNINILKSISLMHKGLIMYKNDIKNSIKQS